MVSGWQAQCQAAGVVDESGWDAEQFVAQSGGVGAAVLVDRGKGLDQDREVPGEQRGSHPDGVDGGRPGWQVSQGGAELGLADPVLDVGAAAEPRLHIGHAVEGG